MIKRKLIPILLIFSFSKFLSFQDKSRLTIFVSEKLSFQIFFILN